MSTDPVAVVFDHLETIDNPESLDVISELAVRLPHGSRLAVSTRTQPPLPTPLLRSRGDVVDVGVDDLAMDRQEAQLLFAGAGVQFSDDEVDRLVEQTEGWPAGLYLAALASKIGRSPGTGFTFRGDDRLMGDYLRSEVFAELDPAVVTFLTRTAILEHLSGPLCDAVLENAGIAGRPRVARIVQPPARPPRSPPRVVPLPPPVPRPPPGRSATQRA